MNAAALVLLAAAIQVGAQSHGPAPQHRTLTVETWQCGVPHALANDATQTVKECHWSKVTR